MLILKLLLALSLFLEFILVPLYIKAMWPKRNRKSLALKMICSTLFICSGILSAVISGNFDEYAKLILAGLALGWVGDFFLHVSNKSVCLMTGLLSFLFGHVLYIAAYCRTISDYFPEVSFFDPTEVAVFITFIAAFILFAVINRQQFAKALVPVIFYSVALVLMFVKAGSFGVRMALADAQNGAALCLMLIPGVSMFLISDFLLAVKVFLGKNETRKVAAFNIATYFAAQNLLACTIMLV